MALMLAFVPNFKLVRPTFSLETDAGSQSPDTFLDKFTTAQKEQWPASVVNARWRWTHRRAFQRASPDASRRLLRRWLTPHDLVIPFAPPQKKIQKETTMRIHIASNLGEATCTSDVCQGLI
jgi:hypothetical protein